jgi:hypothetical protein
MAKLEPIDKAIMAFFKCFGIKMFGMQGCECFYSPMSRFIMSKSPNLNIKIFVKKHQEFQVFLSGKLSFLSRFCSQFIGEDQSLKDFSLFKPIEENSEPEPIAYAFKDISLKSESEI